MQFIICYVKIDCGSNVSLFHNIQMKTHSIKYCHWVNLFISCYDSCSTNVHHGIQSLHSNYICIHYKYYCHDCCYYYFWLVLLVVLLNIPYRIMLTHSTMINKITIYWKKIIFKIFDWIHHGLQRKYPCRLAPINHKYKVDCLESLDNNELGPSRIRMRCKQDDMTFSPIQFQYKFEILKARFVLNQPRVSFQISSLSF